MIGITIFLLVLAAGAAFAQTEEPGEPPPSIDQAESDYNNFTAGQRWGTWALNEFVFPGLGSYMIMKDTLGGNIQIAIWGVGAGLVVTYGIITLAAYYKVVKNYSDDFDKYHDNFGNSLYDNDRPAINLNPVWDAFRTYLGFAIAGGVLVTANTVFNIVRSATYDKPQPKVGSLADINAWSLAVLPGANGVERVQLAYTLQY